MTNVSTIFPLILAGIILIPGIASITKFFSSKSIQYLYFGLIWVAAAAWCVTGGYAMITSSSISATYVLRGAFVSGYSAAVFFFLFFHTKYKSVLRIPTGIFNIIAKISLPFLLIGALTAIFTPAVVYEVTLENLKPTYGALYWYITIPFFCFALLAIFLLFAPKKLSPKEKRQLLYLQITMTLTTIIIFFTNVIIPNLLKTSKYSALGTTSLAIAAIGAWYIEIEEYNKYLEARVKSATKKLKKNVSLLKATRKREQEIIDVMGHELRSPATVAKMAIDQIMHKNAEGTINKQDLNENLELALLGINQQYQLAERYITAAHLSKHTFKPKKTKFNLYALTRKIKLQYTPIAKAKEIQLTLSPLALDRAKRTVINADQQAITQVISNLLDNAIKYTPAKGKVTISLTTEKRQVKLQITDTGEGILRNELQNLGKRFFRGKRTYSLNRTGSIRFVTPAPIPDNAAPRRRY